jgi:hypothetical protein
MASVGATHFELGIALSRATASPPRVHVIALQHQPPFRRNTKVWKVSSIVGINYAEDMRNLAAVLAHFGQAADK